ncbi:MAG TPA: hypothetical protein VKA21_06925 [Candidatus Binatia bacterium]|nr:hypothetical protein [Candidatus Binatia bacterium]
MRTPLVFVVAVVLAGCRAERAPGPSPLAPPEPSRIAVLAFQVAEGAVPPPVPSDLGLGAARALAARLASEGLDVVDPDRVFGATGLVDTGTYDPAFATRVARRVGANLAALGVITRLREREGTAWAAKTPASLAYQATLVRARDGAAVTVHRFDYTQQALTQNLLDLPRFVKGGARWLTAAELLHGAVGETAEHFASALGVRRAPAPR